MKFNNALEIKRLENRWKKLRVEYKEAGMSDDAIEKMWEFDWKALKNERTFCRHNQYIDTVITSKDDCEEIEGAILFKFRDSFIIEDSMLDESNLHTWLEEIDNESIYKAIKNLKEADIELLGLFAFQGYTMAKIGEIQGMSQQAISKRIKNIRKIIKEVLD